MASIRVNWYRDPSKDIVSKSTLYTDTPSPVVGTILYNNLGEDSGMKVSTVNQDGSFEVESSVEMVTVMLTKNNKAVSATATINDIDCVLESYDVVPSSVSVEKGKLCTVSLTFSCFGARIYLDDVQIGGSSDNRQPLVVTFTPTTDCIILFDLMSRAPSQQ